MIIYQPHINSTDRVIWHGGELTQLHYEQQVDGWDGNPDWIDRNVQTLGSGIPTSMSEMHTHMQEFYNYCQVCEFEQRMAMAD
jgi:hypothetical protein